MFRLQASKTKLELLENELITTNSLNIYHVYFQFDDSWNDLMKTATFKAGNNGPIAVQLDDSDHCVVPWEVLKECSVGSIFRIGVFGLYGSELILPTIWVDAGVVKLGAYSSDETKPKDPDIYQKVLEELYKTRDHQNLINRDARDVHPIDSISGLEELDSLDVIKIWNSKMGGWVTNG